MPNCWLSHPCWLVGNGANLTWLLPHCLKSMIAHHVWVIIVFRTLLESRCFVVFFPVLTFVPLHLRTSNISDQLIQPMTRVKPKLFTGASSVCSATSIQVVSFKTKSNFPAWRISSQSVPQNHILCSRSQCHVIQKAVNAVLLLLP